MPVDPRISDLLLTWEEARAQGKDLPAEELCRDCPDLMPEVTRCLRALQSKTEVLDPYASDDRAPPDLTPEESAGGSVPGYTMLEEIGRGGAGVVYKARQTALNRLVAIKMILAGQYAGEVALTRFKSEAQTLARLRHPHIVQVYDIAVYHGAPYFVLEYLDGGNLADFLDNQPLEPREAAQVVELLARTIHQAHEQGVVHRDLKPANVLLERVATADRSANAGDGVTPAAGALCLRGQWLRPKISDFGLARPIGEPRGLTGSAVVGTPGFMAPEQALGKNQDIGPATDVYGLGVLLYQLLTCTLPLASLTAEQTMHRLGWHPPEPPSRRRACPAALDAICMRCLEREPGQRYANAAALADDVRRFLDGEKVLAINRAGRPLLWPALTALALLGVVGGLSWHFWPAATTPSAAAPGAPPLAAPKPATRIGVLVSLDGPHAAEGKATAEAIQLAADELKARGKEVVVKIEDGAGNPERFAQLAEKLLVDDKVDVLIGCWTPAERNAAGQVAARHQRLLLCPAPFVEPPGNGHVYCLGAHPDKLASAAAIWCNLMEQPVPYAVVGDGSPLSVMTMDLLKTALARRPRQELTDESWVSDRIDFHALATALAKNRPQLIFDFVEGPARKKANKAFADLQIGRTPRSRFVFFAVSEQAMLDLDRQYWHDNYVVSSFLPGDDRTKNKTFLPTWRAGHGGADPGPTATTAFCALHLWWLAKEANAADVRAGLGVVEFDGPAGIVRVDTKLGVARTPIWISQITSTGAYKGLDASKELPNVAAPGGRTMDRWQAIFASFAAKSGTSK